MSARMTALASKTDLVAELRLVASVTVFPDEILRHGGPT